MPLLRAVFFFFLFLLFFCAHGQKHTVSGYVYDANSGESLAGASVYLEETLKGTSTNAYGFYSFTVESGNYTVVAKFLGFQEEKTPLRLQENTRMNFNLSPTAITTKEVEITGERERKNVESTQMGTVGMNVEQIKSLPAFLGEVDLLKTVQFLPGVQSGGEGNTGLYVRGGGPDQNLILLDEALVYNPSHLFGFFSIFNADAVNNINLIKGDMPANYGGRLASVLDISMNEGNMKHFQADGGIGLISSRLTLQGPIVEDTSSFIVSGRRTYIDILAEPFISNDSPFKGSGYYFYDLNTKINYRPSDKDRFFLSGYFGRDVFVFNSEESDFFARIPWGNAMASARWNHLFSDRLFANTTLTFSDFQFGFEAEQDQFEFKLFSGIQDYNAKTDFHYYPSIRHGIKFGGAYTYHIFTPSSVTARSGDTEFDTGEIEKIYAHEAALYVLDEFDISDVLRINAGLRFSFFQQVGPFTRYLKDEFNNTTGTITYESLENVVAYRGLEPRFALRYKLNFNSSIKAAFTQNYQYVHLASLSSVSLPTDVWIPSSSLVEPQLGRQYSTGYFKTLFNNKYEVSVETYYKSMDNLIEYKEGAQPEDNVNDNVDNQLTFGNGYSYGLEFFFQKKKGPVTGWVGYTWSKTARTFEEINNGKEFPARYDRRHDVSVVTTYDFSERWQFSGVFVYATGNTATLPVARYFIEGQIANEFGERNGFRMLAYHRADLAATYSSPKDKRITDPNSGETLVVQKKLVSSWTFSIFNIYNRANPYFIFFDNEGELTQGTLDISAQQVSLFPILPSVTWNFTF